MECHAIPGIDTVRVYFRHGYSRLDLNLRNNESELNRFIERLQATRNDTLRHIVMLYAEGNASPVGSSRANLLLSRNRAKRVLEYIRNQVQVDDSLIQIKAKGIDWEDLTKFVTNDPSIPERERVLKILRDTPEWIYDKEGHIADGRKRQLMNLRGGTIYRRLQELFFADLRVTYIELRYEENIVPQPATHPVSQPDTVLDIPPEIPSPPAPLPKPEEKSETTPPNYRLVIKTNLLYDAILMPSLEVEYRINERWTVNLEGDMAWWHNNRKHRYYQVATISLEGRFWFGQKKNDQWHGHYLGLFGGFTWYDLENGKRGYKGEAEIAGISYGYMFPIGQRMSLEAGVGAGYMHSKYEEYLPMPYMNGTHYVYQQTNTLNYFGPLKLKLALVWHLWDINKKKGGRK